MTLFAPLFTLTVTHAFHGDAGPAPIRLAPDAATAALARAEGLRLRLRDGLAEAFAPEAAIDAGAVADPAPRSFTFTLTARDPALVAMTAPLADVANRILRFDAPDDAPRSGGEPAPRPASAPTAMLGIVTVRVPPDARDARRTIRLEAASLSWTYHILGADPDRSFSIRDRRDEIAFAPLGPRRLSNGAEALSFRSDGRIAASARAPARFDLVAEGPFGPRVVAPALPNAAASSLSLIDGRLNSDIFFVLG